MNEVDSARSLLYDSDPLASMKNDEMHSMRYCRLQQILINASNGCVNLSNLYGYSTSKEVKRRKIAESVQANVFEAPPSRLLSLINDALKYRQLSGKLIKGQSYDLFKDYDDESNDDSHRNQDRMEQIVRKNTCIIPFGASSSMTFIAFSPDGNLLVAGSSDGFIEIFDYDKGKLIKDSHILTFQSNDELLLHNEHESVQYIAFSNDSQLMATGGDKGSIKIWRIYKGINSVTFNDAHSKSVTSLCFNKNGTQILSSSIDGGIKIHGLKSKRMLKEFIGHKSFVHKAVYIHNDEQVVSCSADGSIKIWDTKTTNCIHQITNIQQMPPQNTVDPKQQYLNLQYGQAKNDQMSVRGAANTTSTTKVSIRTFVKNPANKDEVYVILSNESFTVYVIDVKTGKLIKKIESEKLKKYLLKKQKQQNEADQSDFYFSDVVVSFHGQYFYALGEPDHILYCFNTLKKSKKKQNKSNDLLANAIKIHDKSVTCLAMHPHRNIMASISDDRKLKIWRP